MIRIPYCSQCIVENEMTTGFEKRRGIPYTIYMSTSSNQLSPDKRQGANLHNTLLSISCWLACPCDVGSYLGRKEVIRARRVHLETGQLPVVKREGIENL